MAQEFFETYARALLRRDANAITDHYAVPAFIAGPEQLIAVTHASETRAFFNSAFGQYEGITEATPAINILTSTAHSAWADVTWSYDGAVAERSMYQLVYIDEQWKIAVLTPLELDLKD